MAVLQRKPIETVPRTKGCERISNYCETLEMLRQRFEQSAKRRWMFYRKREYRRQRLRDFNSAVFGLSNAFACAIRGRGIVLNLSGDVFRDREFVFVQRLPRLCAKLFNRLHHFFGGAPDELENIHRLVKRDNVHQL